MHINSNFLMSLTTASMQYEFYLTNLFVLLAYPKYLLDNLELQIMTYWIQDTELVTLWLATFAKFGDHFAPAMEFNVVWCINFCVLTHCSCFITMRLIKIYCNVYWVLSGYRCLIFWYHDPPVFWIIKISLNTVFQYQ